MQFAEEEIASLAETIWGSLLGLPVECLGNAEVDMSGGQTLTGCIHITGRWEGALVLQSPAALARGISLT